MAGENEGTLEAKKALPLPTSGYEGYRGQLASHFRNKLQQGTARATEDSPLTARVVDAIDEDVFGKTTLFGKPHYEKAPDGASFVPFAPINDFLAKEGPMTDAEIADAEKALGFVTEVGLYKYGRWPHNRDLPKMLVERQQAFAARFPERPKPSYVAMTREVLQQAKQLLDADMEANPNYSSFPDKVAEVAAINAALIQANELAGDTGTTDATEKAI